MASTQQHFVSVPRGSRDVTALEAQVERYAGPGCVSLAGSVSDGTGCVTIHVPADPPARSEVLRIIKEWRDAGPADRLG